MTKTEIHCDVCKGVAGPLFELILRSPRKGNPSAVAEKRLDLCHNCALDMAKTLGLE